MKRVKMKRTKYILLGILVTLIGCKKCPPPVENEERVFSSLTIAFKPMFETNPMTIKAFGNVNMHNEDILVSNWGIIMSDVSLIKEDNTKIKLDDGYMYVNEAPGLGVDVNEELAAKYPLPDVQMNGWTQVRKNDGTIIRP